MELLQLTKHHALGNDFLVTFDSVALADGPALARRLCDRRRGIGADGLLLGAQVSAPPDERWRMVLFNADGSRAEMSGNGIRCFAQAVVRAHGPRSSILVDTDAGEREVRLAASPPGGEGDVWGDVWASVSMGGAKPIDPPSGWAALRCAPDRPVAHLSMGNPHAVVLTDAVAEVDLAALGALVPDVNLEIVEPGPEPDAITMRVHERGSGITEACGTGASAAAYAAVAWGVVAGPKVVVHQPGGDALVEVGDDIVLAGPSQYVGSIEVAI